MSYPRFPVLALLLLLLAGCGNTGDLFLPPPPVSQVPEKAPNTAPVTAPAPPTKAAAPSEAGATERTAP